MSLRNRELSAFMCRELLYEYMTNNLDEQRKSAVERHLESNPQAQDELRNLQSALKFCEGLSQVRLSTTQWEEIISGRNRWTYFIRFVLPNQWPISVRLTAEALLISIVVFTIAMFIPWNKLTTTFFESQESVELIQVKRKSVVVPPEEASLQAMDGKKNPIAPPTNTTGNTSIQTENPSQKTKIVTKSPPMEIEISEKTSSPVRPEKQRGNSQKRTNSLQNGQTKGVLFRGKMKLTNADVVVPLVIQKIKELGGAKAGKVDLGWRKKKGHYFHLTMPKSNYKSLIDFLKGFGPVRIYREPHKRVMPEGEIRFILWIEDTETN